MRRRERLRCAGLIAAALLFCIGAYRLLKTQADYREAGQAYAAIAEEYATTHIAKAEQAAEDGTSPPVDVCDISVDFDELTTRYPDIVGWLYCPDTPINYPVMRGETNQTYLRALPDGSYGLGGSLFLDYRCSADGDFQIIYGHSMKDGSMFGSLRHYAEQDYYDAHPVLWYLTPEATYRLDVFAGYTTDTGDMLYTLPADSANLRRLIVEAMDRSDFDTMTYATAKDGIVVLSTCSYAYENARYVVLGTLTRDPRC